MTMSDVFNSATERRSLDQGDVLFAEGDNGAEMFGVIAGSIELRHGGDVVETVGPGHAFGEMAIIDHSLRSLTSVASEPSEVVVINEHVFLFLVDETPTFALQVMRSLTERLRRLGLGL